MFVPSFRPVALLRVVTDKEAMIHDEENNVKDCPLCTPAFTCGLHSRALESQGASSASVAEPPPAAHPVPRAKRLGPVRRIRPPTIPAASGEVSVPQEAVLRAEPDEAGKPAPVTPPRRPRPSYTPVAQLSPAMRLRKGGARRLRFARLGKKLRGSGIWSLMTSSAKDFVEEMQSSGLLPYYEIPACTKCAEKGKEEFPKPVEHGVGNIGYRCRCGKRWSLREMLPESDQDFWLPKVPIRKQVGAI